MKGKEFLEKVKQRYGIDRWARLVLDGFRDLIECVFGEKEEILGDYSIEKEQLVHESDIKPIKSLTTTAFIITETRLLGFEMAPQELKYDFVPLSQIEHISVGINYGGHIRNEKLIDPELVPSTLSIHLKTKEDWMFGNPLVLTTNINSQQTAKKLLNEFIKAINEAMSR